MARRSESALASLLLVSRSVPSDERPLSAREFWSLIECVDDPSRLLGCDTAALEQSIGSKLAPRVAALLDRATALALELERLDNAGIATLSPFDDLYPTRWRDRLGASAPALVHTVGPARLLDRGGIAIVGSRDVSPDAAEVAKAAAAGGARAGRVVISGGARGTDRLAMNAATESEGEVAGILADALSKTANDPEVRRLVGDERLCLATPYAPTAPFSAGNAMGRNKLIYASADVTLVVASDLDKGGTWAGAAEALKHNYGQVAVWLGEGIGTGNAALAERGAVGVIDLQSLDDLASAETAVPAAQRPEQLGLHL
ncbi:MAG: DNA-processing protein DprA [Actinomycetota bacterium]|nr:DNA-processing protein DprA [Actinomycetota bacterium]